MSSVHNPEKVGSFFRLLCLMLDRYEKFDSIHKGYS